MSKILFLRGCSQTATWTFDIQKKSYKTFSAKSIMRPLSIYSAQKFNKNRFFKKRLALHRFILLSKYDVWSLRRKKFQMGYKIRTSEVQIFVRCKRSKWGTVPPNGVRLATLARSSVWPRFRINHLGAIWDDRFRTVEVSSQTLTSSIIQEVPYSTRFV